MPRQQPTLTLPSARPGGPNLDVISAQTRSLVFSTILSAGPMSRTQVALRSGLSPSTVTKVVTPLLAADYLVDAGPDHSGSGAGRPQRLLAVDRDRHPVIGLKLHPTHVTGVLTDLRARVLGRAERPLDRHDSRSTLVAAAGVVQALLDHGASPQLLGVGIGVGGHVDGRTGVVVHSGVLGWDQVDVAGPLARATGLPVVVNNDLNALAVAERWFGKGRDIESFAVVSTGAGVGCGLMLRGALHAGANGLAGEFGHIPLDPGGTQCSCGNRGCLETVASDEGILRGIRERGGPACGSATEAMRLAREDTDAAGMAAREAYGAAGDALGRGLATLCNLLNLERIILSGEGVAAYDLLGPALETAWRTHAFSTAERDCELVLDAVDDDLWARGAACLVIDRALQSCDASTTSASSRRRRQA